MQRLLESLPLLPANPSPHDHADKEVSCPLDDKDEPSPLPPAYQDLTLGPEQPSTDRIGTDTTTKTNTDTTTTETMSSTTTLQVETDVPYPTNEGKTPQMPKTGDEVPQNVGRDAIDPRSGDIKHFPEELAGWGGYIEWEQYPDKKEKAHELLATHKFDLPPEFQLVPLPTTNPVLHGARWEQYHAALGSPLRSIPARSWATVIEEKAADMIHLLDFPYNGETPSHAVMASEVTANPYFFVRNHGGIPEIDPEQYFLDIDGLVNEPKRLTLADLMDESKFPRESRVVTLQCSGTRRREQIEVYPGDGDELINAPWGEGAISTAKWTGVSLKKVLKYCGGLKSPGKHIELFGADTYFKKGHVMNYVVSVPYAKVRTHEVLLAWEMNSQPLPKIHGAPLRAVVYGYIGARSCKWLRRISAIETPSKAPVQSQEYLYYASQVGKHNSLYTNGIQIQEMPVSSAIMSPAAKSVIVHDGTIEVKGWAYSGGGRWPERVDVSADGGFTWYDVPIKNMTKKYQHAMRLWHIELPVDAEGWLELVCRCWDNALNTEPTYVRSSWNWDLHVTSSAHRIKVYSVNRSRELTRMRLAELDAHGQGLEPITRPIEFALQNMDVYSQEKAENDPRDAEE